MRVSIRRIVVGLIWGLGIALPALWAEDAPAGAADLATAQSLFDERRYAEAQPAFEAVLAAEPDNVSALMYLGKLAAKRRERAAAVNYLRRAVELAPTDAEVQFEYGAACSLYAETLGKSFRALGQALRGRNAMERAVELAPDDLSFRQGLLEYYASAPGIAGGSMDKAFVQADEIARRDLDRGAFARAHLQKAQDNLAGAMETLAAVLERAPDNYFALFEFGRCGALSGLHLEKALAALQRCLELPAPDKGSPPAYVWYRIGQIRLRQNDPAAARAAFAEAVALMPNDKKLTDALASIPAAGS